MGGRAPDDDGRDLPAGQELNLQLDDPAEAPPPRRQRVSERLLDPLPEACQIRAELGGNSPVTSTRSCTDPTLNSTFNATSLPTESVMPLRTSVRKPVCWIVTV